MGFGDSEGLTEEILIRQDAQPPSGAFPGQLWVDTGDSPPTLYTWDGSNWQGVTRSQEAVEDIVGGMASGGLSYDDAGGFIGSPGLSSGKDGAITRSSNQNESGLLLPTTYTVDAGVTLTVDTGVLVVAASEEITIDGVIDGTGQGASGATPDGANGGNSDIFPQSLGGAGGSGTLGGDGGDGGDGDTAAFKWADGIAAFWHHLIYDALLNSRVGGAGGGAGGTGTTNQASFGNGNSGSTPGGGGEGGFTTDSASTAAGGNGGDGGAIVILIAPKITITGTVQAAGVDGTNGEAGTNSGGGGGGGGSAGLIALVAGVLLDSTATYDVTKGLGGSGGSVSGAAGGSGADGADGVVIKIT